MAKITVDSNDLIELTSAARMRMYEVEHLIEDFKASGVKELVRLYEIERQNISKALENIWKN